MLHCIVHEIANDAVDSSCITVYREAQVNFGHGGTCTVEFCIGWRASIDRCAYPLGIVQESNIGPQSVRKGEGSIDDLTDEFAHIDVVCLQYRGTGIEPGDLQKVDEERFESIQLSLQQFRCSRGRGVEICAILEHHVCGHSNGRERRSKFVGNVGNEALLHPGQALELLDLPLKTGGHVIERGGKSSEVVVALHPDPL